MSHSCGMSQAVQPCWEHVSYQLQASYCVGLQCSHVCPLAPAGSTIDELPCYAVNELSTNFAEVLSSRRLSVRTTQLIVVWRRSGCIAWLGTIWVCANIPCVRQLFPVKVVPHVAQLSGWHIDITVNV